MIVKKAYNIILDTVGTTGSACGVDSSVVEIQSRFTLKQESTLLNKST